MVEMLYVPVISQICNRVTVRHLFQNFVSAQYLENKLTQLDPIFVCAFIFTISSMNCFVIFLKFVAELWSLIDVRIHFHSITLGQLDIFSPNFVYMHLYWQDLGFECYLSFLLLLFVAELHGLWLMSEFSFLSVSLELGPLTPWKVLQRVLVRFALLQCSYCTSDRHIAS